MNCTIYCCNYKNVSDAFNALQKIVAGTIRKDKLATWEKISFFLEPGFTIHAKCTPQEPEGYYDVEFYAEVCGNAVGAHADFSPYRSGMRARDGDSGSSGNALRHVSAKYRQRGGS